MSLVVKNPPANAGDVRDAVSILGLGKSPGEGHSKPLQYSCLENSMDRGAWQGMVHRVAKSQTWLKQLSPHAGKNQASGIQKLKENLKKTDTHTHTHRFPLPKSLMLCLGWGGKGFARRSCNYNTVHDRCSIQKSRSQKFSLFSPWPFYLGLISHSKLLFMQSVWGRKGIQKAGTEAVREGKTLV